MRDCLDAVIAFVFTSPAFALDFNTFCAEHKLPPLSYGATLAVAAYGHARSMAQRQVVDGRDKPGHDGVR